MKRSTKLGLILVVIHLLLWVAVFISDSLGSVRLHWHMVDAVFALDAPVYLGLKYVAEILELKGRYEDLFLINLIVVISPAWLFVMGKSMSLAHDSLRTSNGLAFIGIGCAISYAGFFYAAASELAITSKYILWDGCGRGGFPLDFLVDCGFPRVTFSAANFAANSFAWVAVGLIVGSSILLATKNRKHIETQPDSKLSGH